MMEIFSKQRLGERGVRVDAFPVASFRYGAIEDAIAKMHGIHPGAMKTFKSRLKHFQRIGLVSSSPGRGIKKTYDVLDAVAWALCFEFAEFGITPEIIMEIMAFCDKVLFNSFIEQHDTYRIFLLPANFFEQHVNATIIKDDPVNCRIMPSSYIIGEASELFAGPFAQLALSRKLMINLTHVKQRLGQYLSIDWPA